MKARTWILAISAVLLVGADCGGTKEFDREEWRIRGTYLVTELLCGTVAVTGPATLEARVTPPDSFLWAFSEDGLGLEIQIAGEGCTWGGRFGLRYSSETAFYATGSGVYPCTPTAAACHDFLLLTNGGDVCGQSNEERFPSSHTVVPAVGGTLDLTFLDDTWCASAGHAGLSTYRMTRVE